MNLNKAIILGRVTADPALRSTKGGQSVATMSVATNRVWIDKGGQKQEDVEFHNIVTWGKQAEVASMYLKKGQLVLVEGRLATRAWTDKNGHDRKATEIIAERLQFGPSASNAKPAAAPLGRPKAEKPVLAEEELIPLEGDEEDTGRNLTSAFGDDEEINPEDIPF